MLDLYKIGRTKDVYARISNIQSMVPGGVELIMVIDDDIENALHKKFSKKKTNREWFALTTADIKYIKSLMDK